MTRLTPSCLVLAIIAYDARGGMGATSVAALPEYQEVLTGLGRSKSHQEREKFTHDLQDLYRRNPTRFIRQLVRYSVDVRGRKAEGFAEYTVAEGVAQGLNISGGEVFSALLPVLEDEDPSFVIGAFEWLKRHERVSLTTPPVLDNYRTSLVGEDPPPEGLVRYCYWYNPAIGMYTALSYCGPGLDYADMERVLLAVRAIDTSFWKQEVGLLARGVFEAEAKTRLAWLSEHADWRVRMYAAQMVTQYVPLRDPAVLVRLKADKHPFVRGLLGNVSNAPK